MPVRNRLDELQAASRHAPVTEEEEMQPLNSAKQKAAKGKQEMPAGASDDFKVSIKRVLLFSFA